MKKIFGYITLAMALTACGSDEALQEYEQQQDKYPLQFTATVEDGTETRVTADNKWSNGDEIGIQIGTSEDQQGRYTYAANDGSGTWSSENPVSWQEDQTADVTAWYPYGKENADISNQAGGYTQYEFLKAEATGQSSQQTVELVFKHQMAKVQCRVVDAGGRPIRGAKVRFRGYTSVTFDKGEVVFDSGSSGEITPYSLDEGSYTTYVALLAPQTITSGESFIEVTANDKTYRFKPKDGIVLEAGKSYNYKIKIGDNIDYTTDDNGTYHVYTANGLNTWKAAANASPYNASCTLENNIELTDENNWTPVCQDYDTPYIGTFDGNGKFISGLNISSNADIVGFIGTLGGEGGSGTVKNLTLEGAKISSTSSDAFIGAVAGRNNGTISDCHVINTTISGKCRAGGVVGSNWGKISYCYVSDDCSVKVESDYYLGGIVGFNATSGAITACYALCNLGVTGYASVGGIFGSSAGSCTACYSFCNLLNTSSRAGGISGNAPGMVTACYWANVPGATYEFEKGIGEGTDNTDKVGGTDGKTWADAVTGMNSALPTDAGYKYEIPAGETLPVLVKNQNKGL